MYTYGYLFSEFGERRIAIDLDKCFKIRVKYACTRGNHICLLNSGKTKCEEHLDINNGDQAVLVFSAESGTAVFSGVPHCYMYVHYIIYLVCMYDMISPMGRWNGVSCCAMPCHAISAPFAVDREGNIVAQRA